MRINHNIAALNTYSRLSSANHAQSKSLEKLSSGQRINRAGDDAAGLAISEKMRAQIRGLGQASRNAQDGISMIQTAEGALSETHSILQRMRELAVQSSNDTNTAGDRSEIQKEVNQLSSEVNRIAGNTEFNKQTLLDGSQSATTLAGATVGVEEAGADRVSAVYEYTFKVCSGATDGGASCFELKFQGTSILASGCAMTALCNSTVAAYVKNVADEFNANTALSGCFIASVDGAKLTISVKDTAVTACGADGNDFELCLVDIGGGAAASICSGTGNDCAFLNNADCTQTTKGVNSKLHTVHLTMTDEALKEGAKITIGDRTYALWDSASGCFASCADFLDKNNLDANCTIVFDINNAQTNTSKEILQCIEACVAANISGISSICYDNDNNRLCIEAVCNGAQGSDYVNTTASGATGTAATADNGTKLQIGANAGQSFTATFDNMSAAALKVTGQGGGGNVTADDGKVASYNASMDISNMAGATAEYSLDLSSADKASAAISVIDDAIVSVSAERSKLGAYQNRLEHTINNLNTSAENLTAAESRVRDVDMAKEMMEFTKNNILNQAATAMLAQANQQPQGVLQLLR